MFNIENPLHLPSLSMIWLICLTIGAIVVGAVWVFGSYQPRPSVKREDMQPIKPVSQKGGITLVQMNPEMTEENTDIDIIAIHGLDTTSATTWTWKNGTNWLKEKKMLPSQVGPARIFTCDWPAHRFEPSDIVQATIQVHGRRLLDGIQQHLSHEDDTRKPSRPLFFIASCLGGIILAQALVDANDIGSNYRHIREATRGIIFLATPFRGTSFGKIAPWAMPCLEALANLKGHHVNNLFNSVKKSGLEELVWKFTRVCQDRDFPYIISTCYETKKTILPSRKWFARWFARLFSTNEVLVTKSSASLDFVPEPLELRRKHRDMNKFENHNCKDYGTVVHRISCILAEIRAGTPLQQADAWLNSRYYNDEKLQIERLSGDFLPMKDCYINLTLVERPTHAESTLQNSGKNGDKLSQLSQFARESRLGVDIPEGGSQVDLATLFYPRKHTNNTEIVPKRILIHGRAGVGKTTLCKKIVSEFRDDKWPEWSKLFDRVIWIPLRNLKLPERRIRGYSLKNLFDDEFFSKETKGDLAQALFDSLAAERTLFLLDGLDEVAQDLSGNDAMSTMLREQLLKMPNVIITSRPYPRLPDNIHLELETIGFYQDQVSQYMQASLGEQEAEQMESFLRSHPPMHSLMRIPVQLDAFCFLWEKNNLNLKPVKTMTDVYQAVELGLWKRDILRLGKRHEGELVAPGHLESSARRELDTYIKEEELFLERLASAGLYHDVIEFDNGHLDEALELSGLLFDKTIPNLSFLRTSDPSQSANNRKYHFIHLTYQEYFAAKYFVRQYVNGNDCMYCGGQAYKDDENANSLGAIDLFRKHKYTTHYDMVWRFTAGLLDCEKVSGFFEEIERKPRDLLGLAHQRLIMHCLSEANTIKCPEIRRNLEITLSDWLLFQCDLMTLLRPPQSLMPRIMENLPFSAYSEFPERSLWEALRKGTLDQRREILGSLKRRRGCLSEAEMKNLEWLLKYDEITDKHVILGILEDQSNVPQEILDYLLSTRTPNLSQETINKNSLQREATPASLLKLDQLRSSKFRIARIIGSQSTLHPKTIEMLMELMQGDDKPLRELACRAFSYRLDLRGNITVLVGLLEKISSGQCGDRNSFDDIASALESTSTFPKESLEIFHRWLESTDYRISCDAARILAIGSNLSEDAAAILIRTFQTNNDQLTSRSAFKALIRHRKLPAQAVENLVQLLENTANYYTRYEAAQILARQSSIPPETRRSLRKLTENVDALVRFCASTALNEQLKATDQTVAAFAQLLEDQNRSVATIAMDALERQSNLNGDVTTFLVGLLKSGDSTARSRAAQVLCRRSNLLDENVKDLIDMLGNAQLDKTIKEPIYHILERQSKFSADNVMALLAILQATKPPLQVTISWILREHSKALSPLAILDLKGLLRSLKESDQIVAANALHSQSNLPDDDIKVLITLLYSQNHHVQLAAATLLRKQTKLNDDATMAVVSLLEYPVYPDFSIQLFEILKKRSDLSDSITTTLVKFFVHGDNHVRYGSARVMEVQSQVSREVAKFLLSLLRGTDGAQYFVGARTIGARPVFLDKVLDALGLPLQPRGSATTSTISLSLEDIEMLYISFFRRSYTEQLWMQVNNNGTLSIHQSNGTRVASFPNLTPDTVLGWRRKLADYVAEKAGSQKYRL